MKEDNRSTEFINRKLIRIIIPFVIIAFIGVIGIWAINNFRITKSQENNQTALTTEKKQELLTSISKHVMIFNEEEPLIVRINNAEQLRQQQSFFQYSENDDILLIYKDKALIYRPNEDVIVNVGPLYVTDINATSTGN